MLPCRGGEAFFRRLFEPLGYSVSAVQHPLDEQFPEWGEGPYFTVELSATLTLRELLTHLYVLVPVLDNDKHYWIGEEEVQKLLRHGDPWLATHPEREQIIRRYLKHQKHLADLALARLSESDPEVGERGCEEVWILSSLRAHWRGRSCGRFANADGGVRNLRAFPFCLHTSQCVELFGRL